MITISINEDIYLFSEQQSWSIYPVYEDGEAYIRFREFTSEDNWLDTTIDSLTLAESVAKIIRRELAKGSKNISVIVDKDSATATLETIK